MSTVQGGPNLLLNQITGAVGAFSLRKLNTNYTGSCVKIRRSSDNVESDIGFLNYSINSTFLLNFTGNGSGYMTTWYNQIGANNVTQSTTTKQPSLVTNGTIENNGNKFSPLFTKANQQVLTSAILSTSKVYSVFAVVKFTNILAQYSPIFLNGTATGYGIYTEPTLNYVAFSRGVGGKTIGAVPSTTHLLTVIRISDTSLKAWINGVSTYNSTADTMLTPSGTFYLGGGDFNEFFGGNITELLIYDTDQSNNRTKIENNINSYYGIY